MTFSVVRLSDADIVEASGYCRFRGVCDCDVKKKGTKLSFSRIEWTSDVESTSTLHGPGSGESSGEKGVAIGICSGESGASEAMFSTAMVEVSSICASTIASLQKTCVEFGVAMGRSGQDDCFDRIRRRPIRCPPCTLSSLSLLARLCRIPPRRRSSIDDHQLVQVRRYASIVPILSPLLVRDGRRVTGPTWRCRILVPPVLCVPLKTCIAERSATAYDLPRVDFPSEALFDSLIERTGGSACKLHSFKIRLSDAQESCAAPCSGVVAF